MAGQHATQTSMAPAIHSQVLAWSFNYQGSVIPQYLPLFTAEQDTVVENVSVFVDKGTEALDMDLTIIKATTAVDFTVTNTPITESLDIGLSAGSTFADNGAGEFTMVKTAGVPSANLILGKRVSATNVTTMGNTVFLKFSAAPTINVVRVCVTMRISTIVK